MMVVLPHAHLPTARVLHAAVGERYINVCDFLQKQDLIFMDEIFILQYIEYFILRHTQCLHFMYKFGRTNPS